MRAFLIAITLLGCNGDNHMSIDAGVPIDAVPDAPPALDCTTYCAEIQANCTDTNAQYADIAACNSACKTFNVGTSAVTDMSGNTLGCRIYHAGPPSQTAPTTHCAHAGPGGDLITATPAFCSGGDVCTSFCTLEIAACGSLNAPLPGDPEDSTNNPLFQYQNMDNCVEACSKFDKGHPYSTTASGDSLACRLNQAVQASLSVMPDGAMHCSSTAANPKGACAGTAMP
jgi:hypothetical protein